MGLLPSQAVEWVNGEVGNEWLETLTNEQLTVLWNTYTVNVSRRFKARVVPLQEFMQRRGIPVPVWFGD